MHDSCIGIFDMTENKDYQMATPLTQTLTSNCVYVYLCTVAHEWLKRKLDVSLNNFPVQSKLPKSDLSFCRFLYSEGNCLPHTTRSN